MKKLFEIEKEAILKALNICNGCRTHAANALGISVKTLRNRITLYRSQGTPVPTALEAKQQIGAIVTDLKNQNVEKTV